MGKHWHLLNIDRRGKRRIIGGMLPESFWNDRTELCAMLKDVPLPKSVTEALESGPIAFQLGPFGKLATEVIQHIFSQLTEFHRIIVLSVTCKMLLSAGIPALCAAIQRDFRPWAHCRLICVSDNSRIAGLPPNLLTPDEHQELVTYAAASDAYDDEPELDLYSFADVPYVLSPDVSYTDPTQVLKDASLLPSTADEFDYYEYRRRLKKLPRNDPEHLDFDLIMVLYTLRTTEPEESDVLCNLSKGEYVRADRMSVRFKNTSFGELGHALLSQMCWSDDENAAMEWGSPEALIHGPWAGDRFCVVTMKTLPWIGKEWEDVTERVDAFLSDIWEEPVVYICSDVMSGW